MKLNSDEMLAIIRGSTILGTGGGGRFDEAIRLMDDVSNIELTNVSDLEDESLVLTAYGAGGLTKSAVSRSTMMRSVECLTQKTGTVDAIVPVEIGPYSLAVAFAVANALDVPTLDADIVGYRSVPEIYIELATLVQLNRCPLVTANEAGDVLVLEFTASANSLEDIVRQFANYSESNTIVCGYPMNREQVGVATAPNSVSYCQSDILQDPTVRVLGDGVVVGDSKQEFNGFTVGCLTIETNNGMLSIDYKNEFIVARSAYEVLVTAPDLILVVDKDSGLGINNGEYNLRKTVTVAARPAYSRWRTAEGVDLFNPRRLGFAHDVKLLSE